MTTSELVYFLSECACSLKRPKKAEINYLKTTRRKLRLVLLVGNWAAATPGLLQSLYNKWRSRARGGGWGLEEWLGTRPRMSMFIWSGQTVEGCPDRIVNAMGRSGRLINDLRSSNGDFFYEKDGICRTSSIRRSHLKEMCRSYARAWWKGRKETRKKGEKKKKQRRRSVALQTLSSNSIPLPHAFNVSITAKYMWDPRLLKTSKAGAEGRPDLSGTNFNLYSAC